MSALWRVREMTRLMRARADASESYTGEERWRHEDIGWDDRQGTTWDVFADGGILAAATATEEVATHIASLDPEVARKIADLLDVLTDADWPYQECDDNPCDYGPCVLERRAKALADAYLGAES